MSPLSIVAVLGSYLVGLGIIGWWAERNRKAASHTGSGATLYGLSLATLCSAWTYFGAVGDTSKGSWLFLANALGPILAITAGYPIWRRIAVLSKQENVGSLADFLAARYGKSRALGTLVTCVATLGALPYIALQLSILAQSWHFVGRGTAAGPGQSLVLVALLAGFAILFGARRPSLTQHNSGFVSIIAVESVVKLVGLLCVAALCLQLFVMRGALGDLRQFVPPPFPAIDFSFVTLAMLCTATAFTLPRQFHLGFVTLEDPDDIKTAAWIVPLYFLTWAGATLIIAAGIRAGFGTPGLDPHLQVIGIPIAVGSQGIALMALLGGFSAGAAMVIVEVTAVSAMVSNEIVLPLIASRLHQGNSGRNVGRLIIFVRRAVIVLIALLSWLYFLAIRDVAGPMQLGQTALTAFAQLLPPLLGGIYWRRGHARGAFAGIVGGMMVWAIGIAGPGLVALDSSPGALNFLWPARGENIANAIIFLSLTLNSALYAIVSLKSSPRLIDTIQANSFVSNPDRSAAAATRRISATLGDLARLLGQFLGDHEARKALGDAQSEAQIDSWSDEREATPAAIRTVERLLAGIIGAPSARNVVAIALAEGSQDAAEISQILDEAGHAVHFSRELLQTTLESLPQGVTVVDPDLRLVAWNVGALQFLKLPLERAHVGKSLPNLLSLTLGEDHLHPGRLLIAENLNQIRQRRPFHAEFLSSDGATIRIAGRQLGQKDYLLTFTDITDLKQAEQILAQDNEVLEARVVERTHELVVVNEALAQAKAVSEQATSAQGRFVAAASHDLVQPLHAARLFIGNALVTADDDAELRSYLEKADMAVDGAHKMLRALLNLSRLETGAFKPNMESVDASALLTSLAEDFSAQAEARGLHLVIFPTTKWVETDRDLLRSILQNLLLNALRYTVEGRVVVAIRFAAKGRVRIEVRDSGVGISADKVATAFGEFSRLSEGRSMSEGAGLGLSIVQRIAQVLGHEVVVRSSPGLGSVFSVTLAEAKPEHAPVILRPVSTSLSGLRVLCVDDEPDVLIGTKALIERWGGTVSAYGSAEAVTQNLELWDVAIADYQLGGENGLDLLLRLKGRARARILVTATPDKEWDDRLDADITLLEKPISPLALQALLEVALRDKSAHLPPD